MLLTSCQLLILTLAGEVLTMSPTRIHMVPSLSTETASGILLRAEVGEAGTAPGRMGPWARPASSPDQMDTESTATTRVNNGKSAAGMTLTP